MLKMLIPIPMEDASFDFSVLEEGIEGSGGQSMIRVLIVAAQREMLRTHLATVKGAGLTASVMDATPLALMRAVPKWSLRMEHLPELKCWFPSALI